MPVVETPTGSVRYEVCDLTPPWTENPQTIIFHHGVAGHPAMWTDWFATLCAKYRLVRFDLRGHGESTVPEKGYKWTFEGLVDDLLRIADAVGTERFHFVGESIGGTTGIACALSNAKRLLSLTLSNTSPKGGLLGNVNVWREMVKTGTQQKWAAQMMEWRFYRDALDPDTYDWYLALHENCAMDVCLGLADLLLKCNYSKELKHIRTPTLLLSPDNSPFIPAAVMHQMHDAIPDAEIQVFAHSRHGLPFSHGRQCAQVLADFLKRRT